jgi:hypothetical protein
MKENIFEDCKRQKISDDRCEKFKNAARKMENLEFAQERWWFTCSTS